MSASIAYTHTAIEAEVRNVLAGHFGLQPARIGLDDDIVDRYGPDSLEMLDILLSLNTQFDIQIEPDALAEAVTVGDFCRMIQRLLAAKEPQREGRAALCGVTDEIFVSRLSLARVVKH